MRLKTNMPKNGICLYTIERDGCLNGVYTNEQASLGLRNEDLVNHVDLINEGIIYNEIARIREYYNTDHPQRISGLYDCFHFDLDNERVNTILEISNVGRLYTFTWWNLPRTTRIFIGKGFIMNASQICVHYWDA
ncbi:MAG: hypothetical protein IT236_05090 [Bacteroidia bacterium]|nr:hypothetical protein [Bacteroidia bacterium]